MINYSNYDKIIHIINKYLSMEGYSREELLNKLKELVNESEFISKDIISQAEDIEDIMELSKLVLYIYENLDKEKKMTKDEKEKLESDLININNSKIKIYKKFEKKARIDTEIEDKNNEEMNIDEKLLNI
ncbi:hypothetical protein HOF65_06150 [bacterium]|nr:hypothetical protein [bacterium]MBT3853511.1 hypothetical protein [bacterium]MBT4633384.1 hypothetical protein [bacterium]MBT6778761.1 hypothetical protein [bacterium]